MIQTIDVRLFEYVPDADAFIHLSLKVNNPIGSPEALAVAQRGRLAAIMNGNATGKRRIYGDLENFSFEKIVLTVRENMGTAGGVTYEKTFEWFDREFPSHTRSYADQPFHIFGKEGAAFSKRTHTITLTEVDALKFRLMFSCSSA